MTAVKHPFENFDAQKFRRFKTDKIIEASKYSVFRFCQTTVNPTSHPHPPLPQDPRPYAIPAHSRWFSFKKIHPIERAEFPEVADPDEAKEYKRIRNKAIKVFRLYPNQEITTATIRHFEGGDFTKICKIHQFLCLWGLINFTPCFASNQPYPIDARLVNDYSKIFDDTSHPLNANPNQMSTQQHIDVQCTICKTPCGEGHYCSRKYPGVVICPQCFSHQNTLNQLEIPHSVFEFRTLPAKLQFEINQMRNQQRPGTQPQPKPQDDELKIINSLATEEEKTRPKFKEDWSQIASKTEAKSPLDCLILFLRDSLGDVSRNLRLTNHEFGDENPVLELLEFVENDENNQSNENLEFFDQQNNDNSLPTLHYIDNWNEIEDELTKAEDEIKEDFSLISS